MLLLHGGAMATMHNKAAVALQNATTAANVQNIMANTKLTTAKAAAIEPWSKMMDALGDFVPDTKGNLLDSKTKFQDKTGINISEGKFGNLGSVLRELVKKNPFNL